MIVYHVIRRDSSTVAIFARHSDALAFALYVNLKDPDPLESCAVEDVTVGSDLPEEVRDWLEHYLLDKQDAIDNKQDPIAPQPEAEA